MEGPPGLTKGVTGGALSCLVSVRDLPIVVFCLWSSMPVPELEALIAVDLGLKLAAIEDLNECVRASLAQFSNLTSSS